MSPTIISVLGFKGGIAKTTTVINIGASLANHHNKPILLIDMDLQANLTHHLLGHALEDERGISDAILDENLALEDVSKPSPTSNLWVAPSTASMKKFETEMFSKRGRELWLKKLFKRSNIEKYSYILIDNSPAENNACYNSLCASNFYLMPIADYGSMEGIMNLKEIVEDCGELNPSLKSLGMVLTMVDVREGISKDIEAILRDNFETEVFESFIRRNTKFKACPANNKTIFDMEGESGRGYQDYRKLTNELMERVSWQ